jgi:hypothetical protein
LEPNQGRLLIEEARLGVGNVTLFDCNGSPVTVIDQVQGANLLRSTLSRSVPSGRYCSIELELTAADLDYGEFQVGNSNLLSLAILGEDTAQQRFSLELSDQDELALTAAGSGGFELRAGQGHLLVLDLAVLLQSYQVASANGAGATGGTTSGGGSTGGTGGTDGTGGTGGRSANGAAGAPGTGSAGDASGRGGVAGGGASGNSSGSVSTLTPEQVPVLQATLVRSFDLYVDTNANGRVDPGEGAILASSWWR